MIAKSNCIFEHMKLEQVIFIILSLGVAVLAWRQFGAIIRNIRMGKSERIDGDVGWRMKNVLLVAFGQKKMFKRFIPAIFHLFIYVAFLLTQVELIEIFIDGVSGNHRFFAPFLGGFYTFLISFIEILSVLAFVATVIFLWRRNIIRVSRFEKPEMKGWPFLDANLILFGEILLLIGIFTMNGSDVILQELDSEHFPNTGSLAISSWLGPLLFSGLDASTLHMLERSGWWLHILVVFGFITYLPYSKHLHIFFAVPNVYFQKKKSRGAISNIPEIMNEVKSMMGLAEDTGEMPEEIPEFGAKDVTGLSWKNLLEAYTCTECGRCTEQCPANITAKLLSPRKIMMDIRDRADEVGKKIKSGDSQFIREDLRGEGVKLTMDNFDDGLSLFDRITSEEIYACTTCNACVEACPVLINPLEPILELRRFDILNNAAGPGDWLPMFTSIENGGAVWQMPDQRVDWRNE
jgi:heterodisulfide reductase subunit C